MLNLRYILNLRSNSRLFKKYSDDPIKVTPTSKAVGDFAQILVSMNLMNEDEQTIINIADSLNLPESVIDYLNVRAQHSKK